MVATSIPKSIDDLFKKMDGSEDYLLYYTTIVDLFLENNKNIEPAYKNKVTFYKWVTTLSIAGRLNMPLDKVRKVLSTMQRAGIIKRKRVSSNLIKWAAVYIEGFEQHKIEDYYCLVGNKNTF